MNYLLDTCLLSELTKKNPSASVVEWIERRDEQSLFLSVLTIGEIEKGVAKLPDSKKKSTLRSWLRHDLCERFNGRILEISKQVAENWGKVLGEAERDGLKLPVIDSLIAATAATHDLAVVTRDSSHMEKFGIQVVVPW